MAEQWERQPTDTDKSFAAFTQYMAMPPAKRSLAVLAESLSNNSGYARVLYTWSSKHHWQVRARAWDDYQLRLDRDAEQSERLKTRKKRQRMSNDMLGVFFDALKAELGYIDGRATKAVDPSVLAQLTLSYTRVFDQSRQEFNDMPTQRTELTGNEGGPLSWEQIFTLTDEEQQDGFGTITPDPE